MRGNSARRRSRVRMLGWALVINAAISGVNAEIPWEEREYALPLFNEVGRYLFTTEPGGASAIFGDVDLCGGGGGFSDPCHTPTRAYYSIDFDSDVDSSVVAARPGRVVFNGVSGGNHVVTLYHGNGLFSEYAEMSSRETRLPLYSYVDAGETLGTLLANDPSATHLHFQIKYNDALSSVPLNASNLSSKVAGQFSSNLSRLNTTNKPVLGELFVAGHPFSNWILDRADPGAFPLVDARTGVPVDGWKYVPQATQVAPYGTTGQVTPYVSVPSRVRHQYSGQHTISGSAIARLGSVAVRLGENDTGATITIRNGGTLETSTLLVGEQARNGSPSSLSVRNSSVLKSGALHVGSNARGTVRIVDSVVESEGLFVGGRGDGSVTIQGGDASWNTLVSEYNHLTVVGGERGTASVLGIFDGASLTTGDLYIASWGDGGAGFVTISGRGNGAPSTVVLDPFLSLVAVGQTGYGSLTLQDGATMETDIFWMGFEGERGAGRVLLEGVDTQLTAHELKIGLGDGFDSLIVRDGATLNSTGVFLVGPNGRLSGDGVVLGSVYVAGGTVAPGNSPGTLQAPDGVFFESGTLDLEVLGGNADSISGPVSLSDLTTLRIFIDTLSDELSVDEFFDVRQVHFDEGFSLANVSVMSSDESLVGRELPVTFGEERTLVSVQLAEITPVPLPGAIAGLGTAIGAILVLIAGARRVPEKIVCVT